MRRSASGKSENTAIDKELGSAYAYVKLVAENINDVIAVANDIVDIKKVGEKITEISLVAGDIAYVVTVAENIDDVKKVADDIADVKKVGSNIDDVKEVATDLVDLKAIKADLAVIKGVHADLITLKKIEAELPGIKDAATKSKQWAVSETVVEKDPVKGNLYSSKYYAGASDTSKVKAEQAKTEAETAKTAAETAEAGAKAELPKVTAEGIKQVGLVTAEGTKQVNRVTAEGDKQFKRVEDEGDAKIKEIKDEAGKLPSSASIASLRTDTNTNTSNIAALRTDTDTNTTNIANNKAAIDKLDEEFIGQISKDVYVQSTAIKVNYWHKKEQNAITPNNIILLNGGAAINISQRPDLFKEIRHTQSFEQSEIVTEAVTKTQRFELVPNTLYKVGNLYGYNTGEGRCRDN